MDQDFIHSFGSIYSMALSTFALVIENVIWNKNGRYKEFVEDMLFSFHKLTCKVSIKIHYLRSHFTCSIFFEAKVINTVNDFTLTFKQWR